MRTISRPCVRAIGEAMIELAPVGDGLYRQGHAGDTFNTAWHMARWLGPSAEIGLVTRIGSDTLSDAFAAAMAADGLTLAGVGRDPARTMGLYLIELDGAERSFHYWRDTSAARAIADDPAALARALDGAGLIHLSGITLAILSPPARQTLLAALATARAAGAVVSFDPNIRPRLWSSPDLMRTELMRVLAHVDIALPSLADEQAHFGDRDADATLARFAAAGVAEVVLKDGSGPARLLVDGASATLPTPPVATIRDTTGAGDAFNAGYLAGRLVGHDAPRAVRAGQCLAGTVLAHFGARASRAAIAALPPLAAIA